MLTDIYLSTLCYPIVCAFQTLPRVDALGSRQFLLRLRPDLCTVPSALKPLPASDSNNKENGSSEKVSSEKGKRKRTRALDVGAGVGRVTSSVLLHVFEDVVLLEPVESFVRAAYARGLASQSSSSSSSEVQKNEKKSEERTGEGEGKPWKGIADGTKSVTFLQGTLQSFLPLSPLPPSSSPSSTKLIGRVGHPEEEGEAGSGYDVVWCQWCLGHLSAPDLVAFFRRAKNALREPGRGLVVVKENCCSDAFVDGDVDVDMDGMGERGRGREARTVFDEVDSSLTRSDLAWKEIFAESGLELVDEMVQEGLPEGLYPVKIYAMR